MVFGAGCMPPPANTSNDARAHGHDPERVHTAARSTA
jgi:hypothetical protein